MEPRSSTEYLVVHCSATKPSMDIGLREIKRWHVDVARYFRDPRGTRGTNDGLSGSAQRRHRF